MKTIENPGGRKVGLLLIPAFLMLVAIPILKSIPVWVIVISALSFASYLGVLTYYCVRQKWLPSVDGKLHCNCAVGCDFCSAIRGFASSRLKWSD